MSQQKKDIESMVRRIVMRTIGQEQGGRPLVDAEMVQQMPAGSTQPLPEGAIVTPLARQAALERQIQLVDGSPAPVVSGQPGQQLVALGADHGGYPLKEALKETVQQLGFGVIDCGTHSAAAVDYPDFAFAVAQLVANGSAWRGIIVDGAGIGSCMAANKVPGVRAALCYDQATAVNSREHNDANVLTLGAGLIGASLAQQIMKTWLATEFGGGRHGRRVDKIMAIERRFRRD